jgi:hypothetical protein
MKKQIIALFCALATFHPGLAQDGDSLEIVGQVKQQMNATGCWVRLYDEAMFSGHQLILYDGLSLPTLLLDNGSDWRGNVRSLEVGPSAQVTLFREENYLHQELVATAGETLAGPWTNTASIQLNCEMEQQQQE